MPQLPTLDVSEAAYRRRFAEPDFGLDLAEVVADRCRLPRPLVRRVEGSNLVFRAGDGPWIKICPPYWRDAFDAEVRVTEAAQGRLPAPIPAIVESGELEDWRYLVSTHVPGVQIQEVLPSLGGAELERIAADLGQFMRAFHAVAVPGFERQFGPWSRYLDERLAGARELHLSRGVDPARVDQIAALLAARAPALRALGPPVLIHADLTAEGARQAAILRAEGEAKAIATVFAAIHAGNPDQQLLSYQYLQMLPKLAQGEANKVFVIPSEFTQAFAGIGDSLSRRLPPQSEEK